jgi:hypothetical protein
MNGLIAALEGNNLISKTNNGALTNPTSGSRLLDLFGQGGALRQRDEKSIEELFNDAFNEDRLLATKTAFWIRDVRGGAGERRTFRVILKWLANNHPDIVRKNIENIGEYGRYDDLFSLFNTNVEKDVVNFIQTKIVDDLKSEHPSLVAKWCPSINTSSKETRKDANKLAKALNLNHKQYRQVLSTLRDKIKIVETQMCARDWNGIDYEKVPSKAAMNYRKAFRKNDPKGYEAYISAVEKGEKTIKANTLFPYDLVRAVYNKSGNETDVATLDAQWNALPDYFAGFPDAQGLAVVDVSGSMTWGGRDGLLPIYTSIGLGIYCAERATGVFQNKYITFSAQPQFLTVTGKNIAEKVRNTVNKGVGYNTNIQAVFDLILNTAKQNMVKESDMPKTLYIISDMEFDASDIGGCSTNFEVVKTKYAAAGYKMPRLVFWNVNAVNDASPITVRDDGVVLVSGQSPSIFKSLMENKECNALSLYLDTVTAERYNKVVV